MELHFLRQNALENETVGTRKIDGGESSKKHSKIRMFRICREDKWDYLHKDRRPI